MDTSSCGLDPSSPCCGTGKQSSCLATWMTAGDPEASGGSGRSGQVLRATYCPAQIFPVPTAFNRGLSGCHILGGLTKHRKPTRPGQPFTAFLRRRQCRHEQWQKWLRCSGHLIRISAAELGRAASTLWELGLPWICPPEQVCSSLPCLPHLGAEIPPATPSLPPHTSWDQGVSGLLFWYQELKWRVVSAGWAEAGLVWVEMLRRQNEVSAHLNEVTLP